MSGDWMREYQALMTERDNALEERDAALARVRELEEQHPVGRSMEVNRNLRNRISELEGALAGMAAEVVKAEWQGEGGFWEEAACPFCGTNQESYKNPEPHAEGCVVMQARAVLEGKK